MGKEKGTDDRCLLDDWKEGCVMKPKSSRLTGALLALAGATFWGTSGTAQALGPPEAVPMTVAALRLLLGGFLLILVALIRRTLTWKVSWPRIPMLASVLGMASFQPLFFTGVRLTGVAVGTLVIMGSAPVITGLLSYLFLGEKPENRWYISTMLAIVGCMLLVVPAGGETTVDPFGVFLSFLAAISFSVYIMGSKALFQHHPPEAVAAAVFAGSALVLLPVLFWQPIDWVFQPSGFLTILYLAVVSTVVGYLLFSFGLNRLPTSTSMTLALAEPLTAALLGFFLLGEVITRINFAGVILLFSSLVMLSVKPKTS